jgi:predicted RNase H-like HicB family nuclease
VEGHGFSRAEKHPICVGFSPRGHLKYAVIYEKGRRNYSAYVPDLPGCVAAAKTLKETQKLIREAIELHLQGMREDGDKVPEPTCISGCVDVTG